MKTIYCVFQNGSNLAYRKGIIAVCTSLKKAIKIISERYEYDVEYLKPKEYNLSINGIHTYYRLVDKDNNAWLKIDILIGQTNTLIR